GRVDLLEKKAFAEGSRLDRISIAALITPPSSSAPRSKVEDQEHHILESFDATDLVPASARALEGKSNVVINRNLINTQRSVGTFLSSEISRQYGAKGMVAQNIHLNFKGIGGQSFMAFAVQGLKVALEGEANDYLGKGLSGAQIALYPPAAIQTEPQIICGNVALYGATSGSLYVRGTAGERFAVRNSGAHAVVEGVGDHGCEYMTGGSVIVIGSIGRNFAAGMSGGLAFIYDKNRRAQKHINPELVTISRGIESEDESLIWEQLEEHIKLTGSPMARRILERWSQERENFLSVIPTTYRSMRKSTPKTSRAPRELEQGGLHG
ncbi:MAG: glutamate synthase subunit alpha, partial [Proteobacteria bacterium]